MHSLILDVGFQVQAEWSVLCFVDCTYFLQKIEYECLFVDSQEQLMYMFGWLELGGNAR